MLGQALNTISSNTLDAVPAVLGGGAHGSQVTGRVDVALDRAYLPFSSWLAAVLPLVLAACGPDPAESFKARQTVYRFPEEAVAAVMTSPHRFIRVSPAGEPFDLIFDSRIDHQQDRRGFPKIFGITDGPLSAKSYSRTPAGVVACRVGVASTECGLVLIVGGEHWSLLFPAAVEPQAAQMAGRARDYIRKHALPVAGRPAPST